MPLFFPRLLRKIKKLNKDLQERVISSLERIKFRPNDYIKKLVGVKYFSFRVGNIRLILDINKNELTILVIDIGHRRNIYDKI